MRINIKPLSVNQAYTGRRFKTDKYRAFQKEMLLLLPNVKIDLKKPLKINIVFGFSSKGSDIDNPVKSTLDVLQKKFKFNDNQVQELNVKKEIVKKGSEFIELQINEL